MVMAGEDYAIGLMQEQRDRLKEVGVQVSFVAHTKVRTKSDPISGVEYDILDAKLMARVFDEFKTKYDVIGTAYIDRDIDLEKTKDIMGKDVVKGKIEQEKRLITFRDNNYSVVCKSRFKHITDSISLDADEFVGAINDAIEAQYKESGGKNLKAEKKKQAAEKAEELEEKMEAATKTDLTNEEREALVMKIAAGAQGGNPDHLAKIKEILQENDIKSMGEIKDADAEVLMELVAIFE